MPAKRRHNQWISSLTVIGVLGAFAGGSSLAAADDSSPPVSRQSRPQIEERNIGIYVPLLYEGDEDQASSTSSKQKPAEKKKAVCDAYAIQENLPQALKKGQLKVRRNDQSLGPTRSQSDVGYCYAYAGADLLEHWLKKTGQLKASENVSALALALQFKGEEIQWSDRQLSDQYGENWRKHLQRQRELDEIPRRVAQLSERRQQLAKELLTSTLTSEERRDRAAELELIQHESKQLRDRVYAEAFRAPLEWPIPEGGGEAEAIQSGWERLCLESEVKSDDRALPVLVDQASRSGFTTMGIPGTYRTALPFMALGKHVESEDGASCRLLVVNEVFPGAFLSDYEQLASYLGRNNPDQPPFEALLEKACSRKNFRRVPKIIHGKNHGFGNEVDFSPVDRVLDSGGLVSVGMRSQIFDRNPIDPEVPDSHAVVLVGRASLCGEEYYVLRNSWGPDRCQRQRAEFGSSGTGAPTSPQSELSRIDAQLKSCSSDKCRQELLKQRARVSKVPFFCDDSGNYVIRKDVLQPNTFDATWLDR